MHTRNLVSRPCALALLAVATLAPHASAQTVALAPVVVSAERLPLPRAESSARLDLLERADLAPYAVRDAYDALAFLRANQ